LGDKIKENVMNRAGCMNRAKERFIEGIGGEK
jgi:hypothetical protein